MQTLFLVQIPKTAGTSLRLAACRHWGSPRIVSDYGPGNPHTSELVQEFVHYEKDHHLFKARLQENNIALFSSSAPLRRLQRIFPASNILTFVRDPVERVISQYRTACKIDGYNGTPGDFSTLTENQNLQSRYLQQLPLELFGFIGITERYSESLMLLNSEYNCNLTELKKDSKNKPIEKITRPRIRKSNPAVLEMLKNLDDKTHKTIIDNNLDDIEMYRIASELFDIRLKLHEAEQSYAHGKVQQLTDKKIQGWAVAADNSSPCKVRVHINDQCVAIAPAREYQSRLK